MSGSLAHGICAQPGPNQSELTGYHVKRHEFDPEYDQDAECVVAELEFREDDTPVRALSLIDTWRGCTCHCARWLTCSHARRGA